MEARALADQVATQQGARLQMSVIVRIACIDPYDKDLAMDQTVAPAGLLIVWHSRTGAAEAMARAAWAGAQAAGDGAARLVPASHAGPDDVIAAAGYLFACPENLGGMTGAMKEFFDRSYYPCLGRIAGRGYASAIAAGNAGQGAEAQIDRIVTGWRLRRVAPSLIVCLGVDTAEAIGTSKVLSAMTLQSCHDLGCALATGLQLGVF